MFSPKWHLLSFSFKRPLHIVVYKRLTNLYQGLEMASLSKGKSIANEVGPENEKLPSFFKAIMSEALEDGMLEIEGYVARNYVDFRGDSVILTDPNGRKWQIELKWSKGGVWLRKGWQQFSTFYSLEQGGFIVFTHIGDHSGFQVRIFNAGMLEIDYPLSLSHPEFIEAADDAFTRAKSFRSNNPYSAIKMHNSYLRGGLRVNAAFAAEIICKIGATRKITLQNTDAKTWPATCTVSISGEQNYTRIGGAWTKFAVENDLQVGDALVLELIKKPPNATLLVHIFRANIERS